MNTFEFILFCLCNCQLNCLAEILSAGDVVPRMKISKFLENVKSLTSICSIKSDYDWWHFKPSSRIINNWHLFSDETVMVSILETQQGRNLALMLTLDLVACGNEGLGDVFAVDNTPKNIKKDDIHGWVLNKHIEPIVDRRSIHLTGQVHEIGWLPIVC